MNYSKTSLFLTVTTLNLHSSEPLRAASFCFLIPAWFSGCKCSNRTSLATPAPFPIEDTKYKEAFCIVHLKTDIYLKNVNLTYWSIRWIRRSGINRLAATRASCEIPGDTGGDGVRKEGRRDDHSVCRTWSSEGRPGLDPQDGEGVKPGSITSVNHILRCKVGVFLAFKIQPVLKLTTNSTCKQKALLKKFSFAEIPK